ncbi:MAG: FAD/NAD(P)-binding protein [Thermodesulfovibrionales bacterium]
MEIKENIYRPFKATVSEIRKLSSGVRLFKVLPEKEVHYLPGQFFMLGLWGAGEVPVSVCSAESLQPYLEFGIRKVGKVTGALHKLKPGDTLWMRGPLGNAFDIRIAEKRDIIFIAGGIGILPLRALINFLLRDLSKFGKPFLLYGARSPSDLLFLDEISKWKDKGLEVILTVDRGDGSWTDNTGLVTEHIDKIKTDFKTACAYICGPEIMMKNTIKKLSLMGMPDTFITLSLERRMKCGIGKCGQCYYGIEYICINGPVYTCEDIKRRLSVDSL